MMGNPNTPWGRKESRETWLGRASETRKQEHVERQGKRFFVSTVETYTDGWETMIFRSDGTDVTDWMDLHCMRYSSQEEAHAGHERVLAEWQPDESDLRDESDESGES